MGFWHRFVLGLCNIELAGFMIQVDCMCIFFVGSMTYENSSIKYYTGNIPATLNVIPEVWCCMNLLNMNLSFGFIFVTLQFAPTKYFSTLRILTPLKNEYFREPPTTPASYKFVQTSTLPLVRVKWGFFRSRRRNPPPKNLSDFLLPGLRPRLPVLPTSNPQVKDVSYFSCPANHGIFVRPTQVATSAGGAGSASPVSPGDEKWWEVVEEKLEENQQGEVEAYCWWKESG